MADKSEERGDPTAAVELTSEDLGCLILALAEYLGSENAEHDGYLPEYVRGLGNALKRLDRDRFGVPWAILEEEEEGI